MRRLLVLLALALPACGSDNGPTRIEAEGQWSGSMQHNDGSPLGTMTLTLSETGGTVTGTGNVNDGTTSYAFTITGTYAPPNLSLTLSSQAFNDMNLTSTVGETSLTGVINGSGFVNTPITLTRQ